MALPPPLVLDDRLAARVRLGRRAAIVNLAIGLALALLLTLLPPLRFLGWLLGSLFHETGHVLFAWFVGCPAFPAISLAGHAAAFHQDQRTSVLVVVALLLVVANVAAWRRGRLRLLAGATLLAWPLLAFARSPREVGFLLSGHLGELAFAGVFLWRARTGEHLARDGERPLYGMLGAFLVMRNAVLAFGLVFFESARAWYRQSGSFGLTNDYARVANDHLAVGLEVVAVAMLVLSLGVVPLVLALAWGHEEASLPRRRAPWQPAPAPDLGDLGRPERVRAIGERRRGR